MKKFITILISCSLALAASVLAQQDDPQQSKKKKKHENAQEAQPPAKPQAERPAARPRGAKETRQPTNSQTERPASRAQSHAGRKAKEAVTPTDNAAAQAPAKEPGNADANAQGGNRKKDRNASKGPANQPAATAAPAEAAPKADAQAPAAAQANNPNRGNRKRNADAKKPDVQAIKAQHANFHAQPKPQQVPAVTFNQNVQISGSEHWQGQQYTAFRSYRPQIHDQNFYHSHYSRVELIGGGYYYFDGGYWYPAWGYQPSAQYYVYDGPIYAGSRAEPPDKVIADVQASLQEMGYYTGEVDGLLGPLTRQALTGYQTDNGLYTTAAIDEPTLASLGMN